MLGVDRPSKLIRTPGSLGSLCFDITCVYAALVHINNALCHVVQVLVLKSIAKMSCIAWLSLEPLSHGFAQSSLSPNRPLVTFVEVMLKTGSV